MDIICTKPELLLQTHVLLLLRIIKEDRHNKDTKREEDKLRSSDHGPCRGIAIYLLKAVQRAEAHSCQAVKIAIAVNLHQNC